MTPKQILDSFSETLVRDERILSPQERALVATLLQQHKDESARIKVEGVLHLHDLWGTDMV